jgi:DNA polymerase III epsilon subunit-like protein
MTTHREQFLNQCACIDFETTSLEPEEAEIIEQGISVYEDGNWTVATSMLHDCKAPDVPAEASAVNNITKPMLKGYGPFSLDNFGLLSIKPHRNILISHNVKYDSMVLKNYVDPETFEALSSNWLCSYRMAKKLYVNRPEYKSLSLAYLRYRRKLCEFVKIPTEPHRAGYDSYINGLLLEDIIDILEEANILDKDKPYFGQLKDWLKPPIMLEYMPGFGKHAGERLDELDFGYLKWVFENTDRCDEDSPEYDIDLATTLAGYMAKAYKG